MYTDIEVSVDAATRSEIHKVVSSAAYEALAAHRIEASRVHVDVVLTFSVSENLKVTVSHKVDFAPIPSEECLESFLAAAASALTYSRSRVSLNENGPTTVLTARDKEDCKETRYITLFVWSAGHNSSMIARALSLRAYDLWEKIYPLIVSEIQTKS